MEPKKIEGKRLLQINVYVGNIPESEVETYIQKYADKNPLKEYEDIVCLYVPVREQLQPTILVII